MFNDMTLYEILKLFAPLIAIQLGLMIFCLRLLVKENVRNLSKPLWALIIIAINFLGPILYLLLGRNEKQ